MKLVFSILIAVIDTFLTARAASYDAGSFAEGTMSKLVKAAKEKQQGKLFMPGSCWYEEDGCTLCEFVMDPLNANWYCPDFCGPGHTFAGMIVTTYMMWPDGTYAPIISQGCSVSGCANATGWPDSCYLFESESEGSWTCQDICDDYEPPEPTDPRTEPLAIDSAIPMLAALSIVLSCLDLALASSITF